MAAPAPARVSHPAAEPAPAPTPSRHRESRRVRTALKVSAPGDSAEREAEATARRVVAMPAVGLGPIARRMPVMAARVPVVPVPRPQAPAGAAAPPATARPREETSPELAAAIGKELGGGRPLPADVAGFMAPRFNANFGAVRIHTGARAANLATRLGARAFTFGRDIFFNSGQFRPEHPDGLELIAHELTHTIQQREIVQREVDDANSARVRETSAPRVQHSLVGDALDWVAEHANHIPGFRLFTVVIGLNPINMSRVDRSGANILRALVEFLPGGGLIVEALGRYGIFERAGSWIEEQFRTLGLVGSMFRDALMRFIDTLGWRDIFRLGNVWQRARRIFTEPVDRLIAFGRGLASGMLRFIREAILRPLAALAGRTRAYPLLKAVLGQDPVTGEPVPRTAETLIGGFMTLIGQQEIWENIRRANAVARAWDWFQTALSRLTGLVRSIPGRFMATLRSLEIIDLVLPPRAFARVCGAFAGFVGDFIGWAGGTVLDLLQIIFEVVAPRAVPYVRRAAGAFRTIVRDPIRFIGTLVRAGIQGFRQFGRNFLGHLRAALIQWLTGAMAGTNIHIPASFSLAELVKFILSVLGLTWVNIRAKLVRATNETVVRAMETGFDLVRTLVTRGPAAAWEQIVQSVTNLREMVIEQVMTHVRARIVRVAIEMLVSSLNPVGGFIRAIVAIYDTIMFFVERLGQIAQVAASFIDSIAAIAAGTIAPAANRVERTMAGMLVLVISFLARIARLGNVSQVVTRFLDRVRAPIDRGLDRVVAWIVAQARRLGRFVAQAGVPHDPAERLRLAARSAVAAARRLSGRITVPILEAALAAVRVRYGLNSISVLQRGGRWIARLSINPATEQDLGMPSSTDADLLRRRWVVSGGNESHTMNVETLGTPRLIVRSVPQPIDVFIDELAGRVGNPRHPIIMRLRSLALQLTFALRQPTDREIEALMTAMIPLIRQVLSNYGNNQARRDGAAQSIVLARYTIAGQSGVLHAPSGTVAEVGPFTALATVRNHPRHVDSEWQLLTHLALRFGQITRLADEQIRIRPQHDVVGSVHLASDFIICSSCQMVIGQFRRAFPNIRLVAFTLGSPAPSERRRARRLQN
ncbi:MAG TPA: DUF4157 domain-containing protein [Allosphingosinicella sp.]|nr:DUF4157 domain-containing protein [Allosphingosinicella sp.]